MQSYLGITFLWFRLHCNVVSVWLVPYEALVMGIRSSSVMGVSVNRFPPVRHQTIAGIYAGSLSIESVGGNDYGEIMKLPDSYLNIATENVTCNLQTILLGLNMNLNPEITTSFLDRSWLCSFSERCPIRKLFVNLNC